MRFVVTRDWPERVGPPRDVPCNGCTLCCHKTLVMLYPGDPEIRKTLAINHEGTRAGFVIEQMDGKCVYLTDDGCSIWEDRPAMCRHFDCRDLLRVPEEERDRWLANCERQGDGERARAIFKQADKIAQEH